MKPLIQYRGVSKRFGPKTVLDHIDLEVARGEILVLLGPSGTGKTVLLKLLIGLLRPDEGEVRFDGMDVTRIGERGLTAVRRRIGFVFQSSALFDSLSVGENVGYALRIAGQHSPAAIAERVEECLGLVGLPGIAHLSPQELSGGMRKRVAVARALVTRPEALLYDEPTVGLDPANVRLVSSLIVELRDRLHNTAMVVTHDASLAFAMADHIALLEGGHFAWYGTVAAARSEHPAALDTFLAGHNGGAPA